jgi:hypothetical protein
LILRNLPPQESFVAEWQYPIMVERDDLEPEGEEAHTDARSRQLLTLLLGKPMTTGEWEAEALLVGIPRASFFRTKGDLNDSGHIILNTLDKTWSVAPGLIETCETPETSDTRAPAEKGESVTSIKVSRDGEVASPKLLGWPGAGGVATSSGPDGKETVPPLTI